MTIFVYGHEIYVGGRAWRDLERPDGREIDAFDTSDATHPPGITNEGNVVAGSRLIPSTKPHLMSEVFPQLAREGVPRGHGIDEVEGGMEDLNGDSGKKQDPPLPTAASRGLTTTSLVNKNRTKLWTPCRPARILKA